MVLSNNMKKPALIATIVAIIIAVVSVVLDINYRQSHSGDTATVVDNSQPDLPINTLAIEDRPFITLTPDSTGHSLDISVAYAPKEGSMEYEMIYNAAGKQEGALGTIQLASETQPIIKEILLGSRSAGGATTYHEGVTGGSITLTYSDTRLKESWNYLHFDPTDPSFSTTDGKLGVTIAKTGLKKDQVIVSMKTFGYPKTGLPDGAKVLVGPYGYFTQTPVKGNAQVSLTLPSGDHTNQTMYAWDGKTWQKLTAKLATDTLTANSSANVFVVTAQ